MDSCKLHHSASPVLWIPSGFDKGEAQTKDLRVWGQSSGYFIPISSLFVPTVVDPSRLGKRSRGTASFQWSGSQLALGTQFSLLVPSGVGVAFCCCECLEDCWCVCVCVCVCMLTVHVHTHTHTHTHTHISFSSKFQLSVVSVSCQDFHWCRLYLF